MTIWSRGPKYRAQITELTGRLLTETLAHGQTIDKLAAESKAHVGTLDQLTAEIAHSGMLHRDLVELRDITYSGEVAKRLADRLHQFTEASIDADLAVTAALTDHGKHHTCTRKPEPAATGAAE